MASVALGQPEKPVSKGIPPPPTFSNFKFNTIGQEPQLLKRISAPTPNFLYQDRSSPSPPLLPTELAYSSMSNTPRPRSRPSLLEALADPNDADTDAKMAVDTPPIQQAPLAEPHIVSPNTSPNPPLPPSRPPLGWNRSVADNARVIPQAGGSTSRLAALSQAPIPILTQRTETGNSSTTNKAAALYLPPPPTHSVSTSGATSSTNAPSQASPYTGLRALQARLLSSISHLSPPDTAEALELVQSANSHSDTALLTAHRSHTLAQQSLASAREAVAAAQECLTAAEQAKTHANHAATAMECLNAGINGKSQQAWKTVFQGLQDDIRALGEWAGQREGEEVGRVEKEKESRELVESAAATTDGRGLDQATLEAISAEVAKRAAAIQAHLTVPIDKERQRSAEHEADAARRAWSLEHNQTPGTQATPAVSAYEQEAVAREQEQRRTQEAEEKRLRAEVLKREEEARAQQELHQREEQIKAQRLRELQQQRLEVAKFQISEREQKERRQAEEQGKRAAEKLRLQTEVDELRKRRAEEKFKAVAEAKRALEAHRAIEKEKALEEQRRLEELERRKAAAVEENKRAEAKRLIEQRKQRELEELKKKQEAEEAAKAEAYEAEVREAQGRRRQEVMAQKQRASAETAARILAERAKGKSLTTVSTSTSPAPPTPTNHTGPLPTQTSPQDRQYGNLVAKKTVATQAASPVKPRSISGGVKLGPGIVEPTEQQIPEAAPLSPTLSRSAALGLRVKPASPVVSNRSSRAPTSQDQASDELSKSDRSGKLQTDNAGKPVPTTSSRSAPLTPRNKAQSVPPVSALSTSSSSETESIRDSAEDLHVHRRSNDPGNVPVVPLSQVPPASPQAQATNLRFVRDINGVLWDTYLKPDQDVDAVKLEPPTNNDDSAVLKEQSSPPKMTQVRLGRGRRGKLAPESTSPPVPPAPAVPPPIASKSIPVPATIPLPPKPNFLARLETNIPASQPSASQPTIGPKATVSPTVRAPPFSQPTTSHSASIPLPRKPPLKLPEPKKRADQSTNNNQPTATPSDASRIATTSSASTAVRSPLDPRPAAPLREQVPSPTTECSNSGLPTSSCVGASTYDDYSQIAPAIHGDGGWDAASNPIDEDHYDSGAPRGRPFVTRGSIVRRGDHYSPARPRSSMFDRPNSHSLASQDSRATSATRQQRNVTPEVPTLSPLGHSPPVLGKRRYRDEPAPDDHPPARRHWQTDHDRDSGYHSRSARTPPPYTAHEWRSPSPDRPAALQSRIGVRDPAVYSYGAGQSYRPTYATDPYSPVQTRRTSDSYQPAAYSEYTGYDQSSSSYQQFGRHQVMEYRLDRYVPITTAPGRGRGSATRGSGRAGGGAARGGARPLNLEQRISNHKSLTLMHRLESPPRKY